jgi:C1A family cysteine protease
MNPKQPANKSCPKTRNLASNRGRANGGGERHLSNQDNKAQVAKTFGWKKGGLYEHPSTTKYTHEDAFILGSVDLRNTTFTDTQGAKVKFPAVYNQGQLGSCTANALAFGYQFDMLKNKASFGPNKTSNPSRLFIYYYERKSEGTINSDSGADLSDGIKKVLDINRGVGVCSETDWPYDITQYKKEPNAKAISNASTHKATKETNYQALGKVLNNLKLNLQKGFPVVFGFNVYNSFYNISKSNPVMPIPKPNDPNDSLVGGHAVAMVGFNDAKKYFIVRNSWGSDWADNGYFYMPYSYVDSSECSDFWSITAETN